MGCKSCACYRHDFSSQLVDFDVNQKSFAQPYPIQNGILAKNKHVGKYPVELEYKFVRTNDSNGNIYTGNVVLGGTVKQGSGTLYNPIT